LNKINESIPVILPIHPRTKKIIEKCNINVEFILTDPVGYLQMIYLLKNCSLVMTDSGGLQKEAFFFHKPCITLRDETEWVELVENGFNVIVGSNSDEIYTAYKKMINKNPNYNIDLYGRGKASKKIIRELLKKI